MKKLYSFCLLYFLAAFLFYGCSKESLEPNPDVYRQTFVKSAISNNQLVYNVESVIRSSAPIKEVYEIGPEGTFDLSSEIEIQNTNYVIHKITEYTEVEPPEGTYLFTILYINGQERTVSMNITKPYLIPPKNISVTNEEGFTIVKWDIVKNADYYFVKLVNYTKFLKIRSTSDEICQAWLDLTDFGFRPGEPVNTCFEITAVDVKGDSDVVSSESTAQIEFHIDEFKPWWTY